MVKLAIFFEEITVTSQMKEFSLKLYIDLNKCIPDVNKIRCLNLKISEIKVKYSFDIIFFKW